VTRGGGPRARPAAMAGSPYYLRINLSILLFILIVDFKKFLGMSGEKQKPPLEARHRGRRRVWPPRWQWRKRRRRGSPANGRAGKGYAGGIQQTPQPLAKSMGVWFIQTTFNSGEGCVLEDLGV